MAYGMYDMRLVQRFIRKWSGEVREEGHTAQFWDGLASLVGADSDEIFDYEHDSDTATGKNNGRIDVLSVPCHFLVEQKGSSVDLDKPEKRQGVLKTPVQQAIDYVTGLLADEKPTIVCTSNFHSFRFYDLNKDARATGKPMEEFPLSELTKHLDFFRSLLRPGIHEIHHEEEVDFTAARLVAKIHNLLWDSYQQDSMDLEQDHTDSAKLTVRLVFLFYAEDADLLGEPKRFTRWIEDTPADEMGGDFGRLRALMRLLDTSDNRRRDIPQRLQGFPYMGGGFSKTRSAFPKSRKKHAWLCWTPETISIGVRCRRSCSVASWRRLCHTGSGVPVVCTTPAWRTSIKSSIRCSSTI